MIRVTSDQMHRALITRIQQAQSRVMETTEQISSGYRVNRPSDDPVASAQIMDLLSTQRHLQQYNQSITQARAWSVASEGSISQGLEIYQRARDLTLQATNATASATDRQAIVTELTSMVDSVKMLGNSKVGNDFIFSGAKASTPAYAMGTSDIYQGDSTSIKREISPGNQMGINLVAKDFFGDDTQGLIKTLRDLASNISTGTSASLQAARTTNLQGLDAASTAMTNAQSQLGETQNRLDFHESRLTDMAGSNDQLLSMLRDTDLAQASANYAQRQSALNAALKTGQDIVRPSLIDFIK